MVERPDTDVPPTPDEMAYDETMGLGQLPDGEEAPEGSALATTGSGADQPPSGGSESLPYPNQPAQEDLFVSRGGSMFNAIKEAVSGSTRPEEWLIRTNVTKQEVSLYSLLLSENHQWSRGYIDVPQEVWTDLSLRRSIDGGALNMMEKMFIGERARNFAMRAGMMSRASTMNKEQFTPQV